MKTKISNKTLMIFAILLLIGIIIVFSLSFILSYDINDKSNIQGNVIDGQNDNIQSQGNLIDNEINSPDLETIAYQDNETRLHFNTIPVKYYILSSKDNTDETKYKTCSQIKEYNFKKAIEKIEEQTNDKITFQEISLEDKKNNPDLLDDNVLIVECRDYKTDEGYIIPGDASYVSNQDNIIIRGYIRLYHNGLDTKGFIGIELHEILHSFGYSHIENKPSIMNPLVNGLNKIDEDIVAELIDIYK
jgi:hypothetical protein